MTDNRFKNYIEEVERGTTCNKFLEENRNFTSKIKKDPETIKEYKIHKALSHFKRFTIIKLLENKAMCTCALANIFNVSDGTITHHLKILEAAGLIIGKKEGYFTRYYTRKNLLIQLKNFE